MTTVMEPVTEVEQLDVDALRKATILHLLALAEEHNLPWFRQVYCQRYMAHDGEYCSLDLEVDDDSAEAQAAWAAVLGLTQKPDRGLPLNNTGAPYFWRKAEGRGTLPGWWSVTVDTHLYIARGLPEQGPRPEPVELVAAAALAPDDARLPADEPNATVEQAEASRAELQAAIEALDIHEFVSTHVVEGACTGAWWVEIRDADGTEILRLAVHDGVWWVGDEVVGSLMGASPSVVAMFVTGWLESAAREREQCAEPGEIGRPDIVPGDEFADHDAAEHDAVRSAYQAEYGPELVDEQQETAEPEQDWFFTFGGDHVHPVTGKALGNSYVVLHGTCDATRVQMFDTFGRRWSQQYASADGAGVKRFGLTRVELPLTEVVAPAAHEDDGAVSA